MPAAQGMPCPGNAGAVCRRHRDGADCKPRSAELGVKHRVSSGLVVARLLYYKDLLSVLVLLFKQIELLFLRPFYAMMCSPMLWCVLILGWCITCPGISQMNQTLSLFLGLIMGVDGEVLTMSSSW